MNISVFTAVSDAIEWTKHVLFRNFDFTKWLALGFCAFLATLGDSGFSIPNTSFRRHQDLQVLKQKVIEHLPVIIIISIIIFIIIISLVILFNWLSSRGKFMFLDGVVHNRGAVVEPWKRFATLGNSLFIFRMVFGAVSFICTSSIIIVCIILLLPAFHAPAFPAYGVGVIIIGVLILVTLIIIIVLIQSLLNDFIVTIMYVRNVRILPALSIFIHSVLPGHVVHLFLFYLVNFVFGIAIAILAFVVVCCSCCIAAIPYLNSLIFLPILVFWRSFPVFFLQQFSDDWILIPSGIEHPVDYAATDIV